jgi:hypothetical protein
MDGGDEATFTGAYDAYESSLAHVYEPARRTVASYSHLDSLVCLRRASDDTEDCFLPISETNPNVNETLINSFLGGSNGYGTWIADQINGDHITQATAASQPLWVPNLQNGHPGFRLDGSDDKLCVSVQPFDVVSADAGAVFSVQREDSTQDSHTTISADWDVSGVNRLLIHATFGDTIYFDWGDNSSGGRISVGKPVGWDNTWQLLQCYRNGATGKIRANGAELLSDTFSDDLDTDAANDLCIGFGGSRYFKGDIAAILICNSAPASDGSGLESAVNSYWSTY